MRLWCWDLIHAISSTFSHFFASFGSSLSIAMRESNELVIDLATFLVRLGILAGPATTRAMSDLEIRPRSADRISTDRGVPCLAMAEPRLEPGRSGPGDPGCLMCGSFAPIIESPRGFVDSEPNSRDSHGICKTLMVHECLRWNPRNEMKK